VPRLGRQVLEGHGVRPVDKALGHGDPALGVGQLPGVFTGPKDRHPNLGRQSESYQFSELLFVSKIIKPSATRKYI